MDVTIKLDWRNVAIIILILLLFLGVGYHFYSKSQHKIELAQADKLRNALTDTISTYQNKEKQWVSEKLTIQAKTKDLEDKNLTLTQNQKELVKKVNEINKNNQIITAALIEMGVKIAGIKNDDPVITNDSTIHFPYKSDSLEYDIYVRNVKRSGIQLPVLEFNKFNLPNKQLVEFHWKDDKKEGYPISFSVTNSNPLYKVYNMDSYAIPELEKTKVKPTFWNKLGTFSTKTGGKIVFFGGGLVAGYLLFR